MDETILRAGAYAAATLVHSPKSTAHEILSFATAWQNWVPVVIVPSKYIRTLIFANPDAGLSIVICDQPLHASSNSGNATSLRSHYP